MNEQGKKLIDDFRWECMTKEVSPTRRMYSLSPEELENFSERIVRRCAKVADKNFNKGMCPVGNFILKEFGMIDD